MTFDEAYALATEALAPWESNPSEDEHGLVATALLAAYERGRADGMEECALVADLAAERYREGKLAGAWETNASLENEAGVADRIAELIRARSRT